MIMPSKEDCIDILRTIRALIADPTRWCQNHYAETQTNTPCIETDPYAQRRCLLGAIEHVLYHRAPKDFKSRIILQAVTLDLLRIPLQGLDYGIVSITRFNDRHEHREVLDLLDRTLNAVDTIYSTVKRAHGDDF